MDQKILLPSYVDNAIKTLWLSGIDPLNIQVATNDMVIRGFGKAATWILSNRELYQEAIAKGYEVGEPPKVELETPPAPRVIDLEIKNGVLTSSSKFEASHPVVNIDVGHQPVPDSRKRHKRKSTPQE